MQERACRACVAVHETQLDVEAEEIVAKFEKFSKRLVGGPIPDDLRADLGGLIANFKARRDEVVGSYKASFSTWLHEHAVSELALDGGHAIAAMENYFVAGPPFRATKARDDIPDAMIYQSIVEVASVEPVVFVTNDLNLGTSISKVDGITHHKDLNAFIASDTVQAVIADQEAKQEAEDSAAILKQLALLASVDPNPLKDFVSEHGGEQLVSTSFQSPSIPGDDREAFIYMFGNLDDVEFDWNEAAYHGENIYTVPFSGEGYFNITYYVPKWDLVDIEQRGASYSQHNDYVVEADEEALLSIRGTLRIQLSDSYKPGGELVEEIENMSIDSLEDPILAEDLS